MYLYSLSALEKAWCSVIMRTSCIDRMFDCLVCSMRDRWFWARAELFSDNATLSIFNSPEYDWNLPHDPSCSFRCQCLTYKHQAYLQGALKRVLQYISKSQTNNILLFLNYPPTQHVCTFTQTSTGASLLSFLVPESAIHMSKCLGTGGYPCLCHMSPDQSWLSMWGKASTTASWDRNASIYVFCLVDRVCQRIDTLLHMCMMLH